MTSTNTQTIAKIAAVVAVVGLVATAFVVATPTHAQTTTTTTTSTTIISPFTRDLTMGRTGADVTALQAWLISRGFSIPAGPTGYFWTQTRAAVAAFQAAHGITPVAGYFGPITRGVVNSMLGTGTTTGLPIGCTSTSGYSPITGVLCSSGGTTTTTNTGTLSGGAGRLVNVDMLGDVESDLKEGDSATKVIGFEAQARDSDLAVQRVDVTLTISGTTGSSNINRYVDTVALYQDGKKLETIDASNGDKDGRVWTFRFSDINGIIREGNTSQFYVEVTPISSVGTAENGVTVTATLPTDGVRAIDAQGISETYTPGGTRTQTFSVSTATTGGLTLTESSDNPRATVVQGHTDATTDDVTLLAFNARARNQDVTIHDLPISLGVTGTTNVGDVVQSVKLMQGSKTLKTKTVSSGAGTATTVVFDNIDNLIDTGSTDNFSVVANVRSMNTGSSGTAFDIGDTLVASTTGSLSGWDVEDQNGDNVNPSGSATGGVVTFQTTGITVVKNSADATKTVGTTAGSGDSTQYSISFKVTAGDDDLYIDRSIQNTTSPSAAGSGMAWATTTSSTANVTGTGAANVSANDTNSGDTATSYKVPAGSTRTFTLNVTLTATGTGYTGVMLTGINYDTDSNTNDSTTYYTAGLDTFKTNDVSMTMH